MRLENWDERSNGSSQQPAAGIYRLNPGRSLRAATHYAAELRLIFDGNPFNNRSRVQKYMGIKWLQFVPFIEIGRVAPECSLSRLHSDMKWDAGLGIRAWAQGIVIRIDSAYSNEGIGVQMMIAQPFQS